MNQQEQWEQEKIRRIEEQSERLKARKAQVPQEASGNDLEDFQNKFTVRLSGLIAFFVAMPLVALPVRAVTALFLGGEWPFYISVLVGVAFIYPIDRLLQRWPWPGKRRLDLVHALFFGAAGVAMLIILFFGYTFLSYFRVQEKAAQKMGSPPLASTKALRLAGHESKPDTKAYLKKVRQERSRLSGSLQGRTQWHTTALTNRPTSPP